jgi:hypothetical protein
MLFSAIRILKKIVTKEDTLEKIIPIIKIKLIIKLLPAVKIYRRLLKRQLTYTVSRYDRFGTQYLSIIGGIAWCELMNYKYIHTTFQSAAEDRDKDKWNKFTGIPVKRDMQDFVGMNRITKKENENVDIIENNQIILRYLEKSDKFFTKKILNKIKKYYYSMPKPAIQKYDIAIHIRRGDVTAFNVHSLRFTTNEDYVSLIKYFKKKHPNYSICIYSQGKIEDFGELQIPGVNFDLDSETTEVFHSFVQAKILVTAKSNLSYTAALLSDNIIYFIPSGFPPLKHWKFVPNNFFKK